MRQILAAILILLAVLSRLLPHPPNFTPIAALALFGGVYLEKRLALLLPLLVMVVSDSLIGFHATIPWVYGSFIVTALIGLWLKKHKQPQYILGAAVASSLVFFLVTNFGVWTLPMSGYPPTLSGLAQCYVAAIPFFKNELLGSLAYTSILFGLYEVLARLIAPRRKEAKEAGV